MALYIKRKLLCQEGVVREGGDDDFQMIMQIKCIRPAKKWSPINITNRLVFI